MTYYVTLNCDEPSIPFELAMHLASAISELKYTFPNVDIRLKINEPMEIKNIVSEETEKTNESD